MARDIIRYNLRRADALAVETATDDSVNPAGLDSVVPTDAVAKPDNAENQTLQNSCGGKGEISKPQRIFRSWLAIGLTAGALIQVPLSNAATLFLTQKAVDQSSSREADVNTMVEQANKLQSEGMYGDAATIWQQILAMLVKALGPDHPDVARSHSELAMLLQKQGQYIEAEHLYRRSLAIREKALGSDHPDTAASLNNLAELLQNQGQYAAAEALYRRSLAIYEKALGSDHPDVATILNDLAGVLMDQGQYAAAEPIYRRSLAIYEKALGPGHFNVATILNDLAGLLADQMQYAAAETLYRRSLAIYENTLDPDDLYVATVLNNLAELLSKRKEYAAAKQFYQRSLAISEKQLGLDHQNVGTVLNNLAEILQNQGQYAAAEPLYRRSLAIYEKALGPDHSNFATSLHNLAQLLMVQGRYTEAEPLYRRSLKIYETTLGPEHPHLATSLNSLAVLLRKQKQYSAAEPVYRRSLAIREKELGQDHPHVGESLNNLSELMAHQGQFVEAEHLYRRSLAIYEKALGPDHKDVATILNNLSLVLHRQKRYNLVKPILSRSRSIEMTWLLRELPLLPDQARSAQLQELGNSWERSFSWINDYPPIAEHSLETRLNRQGLLPEIEQLQSILLNNHDVDRGKIEQLHALTQKLASVTLPADRRAEVRKQRDQLQAEIYRQIPGLQLQPVTAASVAKALPDDGVLVEFQRYQSFDGLKPTDLSWGPAQYIALVLKPDGSISSIPLGPAAAIDAKVLQALRASAGGLSDIKAIWSQLSSQLLKPLLPQLSGSRQWFLSPDGELNRVPFAALPSPQQPGIPLGQAVKLRLVTTGRELLRLQQPAPAGSTAVVMANPSYDRPGAKSAQATTPNTLAKANQRRSTELGNSQWKPLPGSEREGQQVAHLLGSELIRGSAATSTALQRQQAPRVLHVATHGFFVADMESKPTEAMRSIQEDSPLLRPLRQEDSQLRSGLVFAGANQPDLDPNDDGYLTAAEAVNLNLKGTELVVLSACSTGQGEVRTGEGVYGLQRSLTVAGARSTLLSLWKVDDAATAEFMVRLYQRLKAGEGRSDALATVQQEFRSGKVKSPDGVKWTEPYYWAAWQLVGDWRPIKDL